MTMKIKCIVARRRTSVALDQNVLKLMTELQALATLYGEQFNAMKATIERMTANDEQRNKLFQEQMEALKIQRDTQRDLQSNLDSSVTSLQEVTVALINISDEQQKLLESPGGQSALS